MYKLIIVDDDEVICSGINKSTNWSDYDIEVSGTALDGEIALEMIRENMPDIIIADINMPFLDGLELASIVRQEFPEIKIILLTAYEQFEFAKRAVKLQVHDYITKPFDKKKIVESVCKAKDMLAEERGMKDKIREGLPLIRDKYLYELVKGNYNSERLEEISDFINIPSEGYYFGVITLHIDSYYSNTKSGNAFGVGNIINNEFAMQKIFDRIGSLAGEERYAMFNSRDQEITMIFIDEHSEKSCNSSVNSISKKINDSLEGIDEYFISIGVGRVYNGFENIHKSYEEAKTACDYRCYVGNRSIISIDDVDVSQGISGFDLARKQDDIVSKLRLGLIDEVLSIVDCIFTDFKKDKTLYYPYVQMVSVEIIILVYKSIQETGEDSRILDISKNILPEIMKFKGMDDIKAWLDNKLMEVHKHLLDNKKSDVQKIIDRAAGYIDTNYTNPDLSLTDVASYVHVSPNYLSALFTQLRGINFRDYLTSVRINSAMKLFMDAEAKTYEVAYKVGYSSPQYFSVCFKRIAGLTPIEFKIKNSSY